MDKRLVTLGIAGLVVGCAPTESPPPQLPQQGSAVVQTAITPPTTAPETVPVPTAAGAPEDTVLAAVKAAMSNDFPSYLALVHSTQHATADMTAQIERYAWARFAKQANWYLDPAGNVKVERNKPEGDSVMLYMHDFHNAGRMPPPMRLRLEQGRWRIVTNSL